jgi:hypothetical protein
MTLKANDHFDKCAYCGAEVAGWTRTAEEWLVVNRNGREHRCKVELSPEDRVLLAVFGEKAYDACAPNAKG